MTQIPPENIPLRDGEPMQLELTEMGEHVRCPIGLYIFSVEMTADEQAKAIAEMRKKIEAMSTLTGAEVPAQILERIDEMESEEAEQRAVFGESFQICWN